MLPHTRHLRNLRVRRPLGCLLDIFAEDSLSRIRVQELGDTTRVDLLNWDDCTQTIELDSDNLGFDIFGKTAGDFWTGTQ